MMTRLCSSGKPEDARVMNISTTGIGKRLLAGAFALTSLVALGACAQGEAADPNLSLTDSKAIVQLFRNEVANRVPSDQVEGFSGGSDYSIACRLESQDPQGLVRYWSSGVDIELVAGSDAAAVFDELSVSFQHQGWRVESYTSQGSRAQKLKNDSNPIILSLTLYEATEAALAIIRVETRGTCVETAGAESDEVKALEEKDDLP